MRIEIDSKYSIGDIVRKYKTIGTYKNKITCPLCDGKHFVSNPKYNPESYVEDYDEDYDSRELECPYCNEDGFIESDYVTERVLDKEVYCIENIYVDIRKDGSMKYTYSILSTPELNNRNSTYCSCSASEDELELVRLR